MKNFSRWGILLVSFLTLGGCAGLGGQKTIQASYSLSPGIFPAYEKPQFLLQGSKKFLLRYAKNNTLVARDLTTGVEAEVNGDYPKNARLNGLATYSDDQKMYVAWRPKLVDPVAGLGESGSKFVFVASSSDGTTFSAPAKLSNEGGAFMPQLMGNGRGDVYAAWQDERAGSAYGLFLNVSHDHGNTWKAKETMISVGVPGESFSSEPAMLANEKSAWVVWTESRVNPSDKGRHSIYFRASNDSGESWQSAVPVIQSQTELFQPHLVKSNKRLLVYWMEADGVKGASSDDQGVTWQAMQALKGQVASTQQLLVKTDSSGNVHLLFGGKGAGADDKNALYYTRSADGVTFTDPVRLNTGPEFQASAVLPEMAFGPKNDVMVVWMDFRYFRPVIMGVYSADSGKSWSRDYLLDEGPETGVSQYPVMVAQPDDTWLLSSIRYDTVTMTQGRAVVTEITPGKLSASNLPKPADLGKLESRVKAWWDSRLNAQWATSFDLSDPFMRARTNRKKYIDGQGMVTYFDYEIANVEQVSERRVQVAVKYTSEVPELEIYGKKIAIPKKTETVIQDWIWVDGNWYFLYKDLYGKTFLDL